MSIDTSVLRIDFDIINCSTNCKALQIVDLSNWGPASMTTSIISITPPGSPTAIDNIFQKEKVNVFNTNNLGLTGITDYSSLPVLPDGIYKICVSVCVGEETVQVCKYFLQDCEIKCKLSRKIISVDLNCSPCRSSLINELQDVDLFLDAAQAQVQNCNPNKAMEYYRKASQMLDRISTVPKGPCTNCDQVTYMG